MTESPDGVPHISDCVEPGTQLSVVTSDFGKLSFNGEDEEELEGLQTSERRRERNLLEEQVRRGALQRRMPPNISAAGQAMLESAAAYVQSDPQNPVQSALSSLDLQIQRRRYARTEAARVRSIQNDVLRMEEVASILGGVQSVMESANKNEVYTDLWTDFGSLLNESDPCRAKVWNSLPPYVRSEIETATNRTNSARSLRNEA